MQIKTQLIYTLCVILGASMVIIAYQKKDGISFWRWHDAGIFSIVLTFLAVARKHYVLSTAILLLLALELNSIITSFFFDVTVYGVNQKIYGWVLALFLFIIGAMYNVLKYTITKRQEKENKRCKRDAISRYKDIQNRLNQFDDKINVKLNTLDEVISSLIKKSTNNG